MSLMEQVTNCDLAFKTVGPFWPLLAPCSPFWPLLAPVGPFWPRFAPFCPIFWHILRHGRIQVWNRIFLKIKVKTQVFSQPFVCLINPIYISFLYKRKSPSGSVRSLGLVSLWSFGSGSFGSGSLGSGSLGSGSLYKF